MQKAEQSRRPRIREGERIVESSAEVVQAVRRSGMSVEREGRSKRTIASVSPALQCEVFALKTLFIVAGQRRYSGLVSESTFFFFFSRFSNSSDDYCLSYLTLYLRLIQLDSVTLCFCPGSLPQSIQIDILALNVIKLVVSPSARCSVLKSRTCCRQLCST